MWVYRQFKTFLYFPIILFTIFSAQSSQASSTTLMQRKIGAELLIDILTEQGVPQSGLTRTFEAIDAHNENSGDGDENINVLSADPTASSIETPTPTLNQFSWLNQKYMILIDMEKPSSQKRLYFIDLESGSVEKYFVAHGLYTGGDEAIHFSNKIDSGQTSLGIYLTGDIYYGSYGLSLNLYGLEKSNNNAYERRVIMHGASYISTDFLAEQSRMGRSYGCPAVSHDDAEKLIPLLGTGAILVIHHGQLLEQMKSKPMEQNLDLQIKEYPFLESEINPIETRSNSQ